MGWVINATLLLLYPWKGDLLSILQEAEWARSRFGRVRKTSPPSGFDIHTVQPVACRHTDYAIGLLYILCKSGIRPCSGALNDTWNTSEVHRRMQYR